MEHSGSWFISSRDLCLSLPIQSSFAANEPRLPRCIFAAHAHRQLRRRPLVTNGGFDVIAAATYMYFLDIAQRRQPLGYELGHILGLRHEFAPEKEKYLPSVRIGSESRQSIMNYFDDLSKFQVGEQESKELAAFYAHGQAKYEGLLVIVDITPPLHVVNAEVCDAQDVLLYKLLLRLGIRNNRSLPLDNIFNKHCLSHGAA
ncbi:hypothetical protein M441DRAFT_50275 [Trichoderma asperellum CBS 433.97]|uniref:Uncharacterized protein n=1 Tax=Trichoderma asperellum (strain ATCC 204424 / CBS 433.97 / NBRC 101777) TaxID=1042311 RepID=A0A2T3YZ71_TRIA4|nr:hypothetical protein M441DRAFT_50275 [Trichoderma asperellum CBS 433.97]PTB37866.1 hypothetical protein M441DRAFT_50275 [Trichoderma asperellum CBS 433.97]